MHHAFPKFPSSCRVNPAQRLLAVSFSRLSLRLCLEQHHRSFGEFLVRVACRSLRGRGHQLWKIATKAEN